MQRERVAGAGFQGTAALCDVRCLHGTSSHNISADEKDSFFHHLSTNIKADVLGSGGDVGCWCLFMVFA